MLFMFSTNKIVCKDTQEIFTKSVSFTIVVTIMLTVFSTTKFNDCCL